MNKPKENFASKNSDLFMTASLVPWDSAIFPFNVAQIENFTIVNSLANHIEYSDFEYWRDFHQCGLVSCRLNHEKIHESIYLEEKKFHFIETVLHPYISGINKVNIPDQGLTISPAVSSDLPAISRIAESAFTHERFYVDPRLNPRLSKIRYSRWVETTLEHPKQHLAKVLDKNVLVAFFIFEIMDKMSVYWHLTAVDPDKHVRGYGLRSWLSMLRYHNTNGNYVVKTTISARNIPVLNLYSKLGFRFDPPEMTFHWCKE
jgi:hypothetical protein